MLATGVAVGFAQHQQPQILDAYADVAFSPEGDYAYFVMRQTVVNERQDPNYLEDRAARAGVIVRDQVWLKRTRLADDRVETLREWTLVSAGQRYATIKSLPVNGLVRLGWKGRHELVYYMQFEHNSADRGTPSLKLPPIFGVWDCARVRAGNAPLDWSGLLPPNTEALRLHGTKELIPAGFLGGPTAVVLFDWSAMEARALAVSRPVPFDPGPFASLLALAVQLSRRERIEGRNDDLAGRQSITGFAIRLIARPLTREQVRRLEAGRALVPVYPDANHRLSPEAQRLVEQAIVTPGKVVEFKPGISVPWVPDFLFFRQANGFFQVRSRQ